MRKKTASQIICENFKISPETIFQDYKCTFRSSVLFFGRIYVGEEHFLFIANMFGLVKKCTINIDCITKIEYQQASNSIVIVESGNNADTNQYLFGNFKNNHAYKLMMALWKGEKVETDILMKEPEEQNQKLGQTQSVDASKLIDEGQVEANFFNPQSVETEKQKIVQIQLPCSVRQFHEFFLSDKAVVYNRKKHLQSRNSSNIVVTEWRNNQQLQSEIREINATIKVTGVPLLKEAGMSQVWMMKKTDDFNEINLRIVTQMADVPYCSYFNCQEHITISSQGDKKCKMVLYASIIFNKSTYMKNKILTKTFADMKEQIEFWIKNVKNILEKMKKKQDAGSDFENRKNSDIEYEKSTQSVQFGKKISHKEPLKPGQISTTNVIVSTLLSHSSQKITLEKKIDAILKMTFVVMVVSALNLLWNIID